MRRNRGSLLTPKSEPTIIQPTTPLQLNHNSNSCSNDTICSSISHSNNAQAQTTQVIVQNEVKIRSLLKDLQSQVARCQEKREMSEPNLTVIAKTHDRVRKDRSECNHP